MPCLIFDLENWEVAITAAGIKLQAVVEWSPFDLIYGSFVEVVWSHLDPLAISILKDRYSLGKWGNADKVTEFRVGPRYFPDGTLSPTVRCRLTLWNWTREWICHPYPSGRWTRSHWNLILRVDFQKHHTHSHSESTHAYNFVQSFDLQSV